jgi:hypothetical protein
VYEATTDELMKNEKRGVNCFGSEGLTWMTGAIHTAHNNGSSVIEPQPKDYLETEASQLNKDEMKRQLLVAYDGNAEMIANIKTAKKKIGSNDPIHYESLIVLWIKWRNEVLMEPNPPLL